MSFSALWHCKNKERLLKALEAKLPIPSPCLDASKTVVYWNLLHKKGFQLAMTTNPRNPYNGQNVRGFQVRTPIQHCTCFTRLHGTPGRGTDGPLIVENAFNCNSSSYGFNCRGSRGAPKKWPKYRTPTCVRHAVQGCFWGCLGGGVGLSAPRPSLPKHTNPEQGGRRITPEQLHYTREINSKNPINYIRPGKLNQKQLRSVSVSVTFGKLIRK